MTVILRINLLGSRLYDSFDRFLNALVENANKSETSFTAVIWLICDLGQAYVKRFCFPKLHL